MDATEPEQLPGSDMNPLTHGDETVPDGTAHWGLRMRSADSRFSSVPINICPVGYIRVDTDGAVVNADRTSCFLLGVEHAHLLGRSLQSFVALADQEEYATLLERTIAGDESILVGLRLKHNGGSTSKHSMIVRMDSLRGSRPGGIRMMISAECERPSCDHSGTNLEQALMCLVECSREGICLTDEDDQVIIWNFAMEQLTGLQHDQVLGKSIWDIRAAMTPKAHKAKTGSRMVGQPVLGTPGGEQGDRQHGRYEPVIQQPSEEVRLIQRVDLRVPTSKGFMLGSIYRDNTESIRTAGSLRRREADLALLNLAAQAFTSTLGLEQVLQTILNEVTQLLEVTVAYLWLMDDTSTGMVCSLAVDRDGNAMSPLSVQSGSRLAEWIRQGGNNLVIADLSIEDRQRNIDFSGARADVRSCLFVPLRLKNTVVGAIHLLDERSNHFTSADLDVIAALASSAAVAVENAILYEQAQTLAAMEERQRLAWDLHDGVNQSLFSAGLIAEVLPRLWQLNPEEGRQSLEDLRWLIRGAIAEMREVLTELRPLDAEDVPLESRLRQLGNIFSGRAGIPVTLDVIGGNEVPADVQSVLYRLCREALSNTAKHANASHVVIQMRDEDGAFNLSIRDDGHGFDAASAQVGHHGLRIMQERAKAVGAELSIVSQPQQGTEITIRWVGEGK